MLFIVASCEERSKGRTHLCASFATLHCSNRDAQALNIAAWARGGPHNALYSICCTIRGLLRTGVGKS